jgi:hypothetical protein
MKGRERLTVARVSDEVTGVERLRVDASDGSGGLR